MFGIGGWELFIIAALALLLFGPDKLPEFARTLGRLVRDFKKYQDLMESTIRAEMYTADTRKDAEDKPDPFKKGKAFREKVQSGDYDTASTGEITRPEGDPDADVHVEAEAGQPASADRGELPPDHPLHDRYAAGEDIGVDEDLDLSSLEPDDLGWVPGAASGDDVGEEGGEDEA